MTEGDRDDLTADAESTNTYYVATALCRESNVIMDTGQTQVYFPKGMFHGNGDRPYRKAAACVAVLLGWFRTTGSYPCNVNYQYDQAEPRHADYVTAWFQDQGTGTAIIMQTLGHQYYLFDWDGPQA
ncbi:hypothetical protein GGX14DRAFT_403874 [Mycena pura]|uniref:Uncharacterized protein n=1 Tax=Mycena pura TaxID=153505 RepID=A0AAD6V2H4_9AGAR|nr:hypothetical protein GGX14DRAFT_403874 [Mycena pura]